MLKNKVKCTSSTPLCILVTWCITESGLAQISPACQELANNNPPGQFEQDPPGGGFPQVWEVTHEYGWMGPFQTVLPEPPTHLQQFGPYVSVNRLCVTTTFNPSYTVDWSDSWNVSGTVGGSATAEAKAGVVLAQAKASATVHASVTGGLSGSVSYSVTISESAPVEPCTAIQHKSYVIQGGATASAPYVDLIITHTCIFGDCVGHQWTMQCGATTITAVVIGMEMTDAPPDAGWSYLDPPENCPDCGDDPDAGGGDGGGEPPWFPWDGFCIEPPDFIVLDPDVSPEDIYVQRGVSDSLLDLLELFDIDPDTSCDDYWIDVTFEDDQPTRFIFMEIISSEGD